jgi:hypothetical protein
MSFRPAFVPSRHHRGSRRRHRRHSRRRSSPIVSSLIGVLLSNLLALLGIALFLGLLGRGCSTPVD